MPDSRRYALRGDVQEPFPPFPLRFPDADAPSREGETQVPQALFCTVSAISIHLGPYVSYRTDGLPLPTLKREGNLYFFLISWFVTISRNKLWNEHGETEG
jgi:hypothetical protein